MIVRRTVLISILILLAFTLRPLVEAHSQGQQHFEMDNALVKVTFEKSSKTWSLFEYGSGGWQTVIHNASTFLTLRTQDSLVTMDESRDIKGTIENSSDEGGAGRKMDITGLTDRAEWTLSFVMHTGEKLVIMQVAVKNRSADPWLTGDLHMVDALQAGYFQGWGPDLLLQTNGYQSWSACGISRLDSASRNVSYWSMVLFDPSTQQSCLMGFLTGSASVNSFQVESFDRVGSALSFTTCSNFRTASTKPGAELRSDRLLISPGGPASNNAANYAALLSGFAPRVNKPFTPAASAAVEAPGKESIPAGWCSWYYYYQHISEDSILENVRSASKSLKEAGLRYIQIDDGYQLAAGDWDANGKFPHGHKWLVDQIHEQGFLAGLWLAPFAVAESSTVFKEHKDWLLYGANDSLKEFFANEWWGGRIYSLDPTIPAVQTWLEKLFTTVTTTWGYDYVKIDFLYFAGEGGRYHLPVSSAVAYQMGLQAIRKGVGPDRFILGCGAPIGSSIGYVDGMRIGSDVYASWSGILPAVGAAAQRAMYQGKAWYDDPDCLVARDPLTMDQARVWASIVALSGQINMMSDRLFSLPKERTDLLKMTLPVYDGSGYPVDLYSAAPEDGLTLHPAGSPPAAGSPALTLPSSWKFAVGDSSAWCARDFPDDGWKEIAVPSHWEAAGYPDVDGFAWYRVKFTVPPGWKRGDVVLSFGRIDDCDQTFVNGKLIGETGTMPPNYDSEWPTFRAYTIPRDVIDWKGENAIAVRVYDGGGPGGIYSIHQDRLPTVWNLPVTKSFERWNVVGLFNWSATVQRPKLNPADLGLAPKKTYIAYELWTDTCLGELNNASTIDVPPTGSRILSVHEKVNRPFILASSRHITQGAVDIVEEQWDPGRKTLSVKSDNLLRGSYKVTLYLPQGYTVKRVTAPAWTAVMNVSDRVTTVTFNITGIPKLAWNVVFK